MSLRAPDATPAVLLTWMAGEPVDKFLLRNQEEIQQTSASASNTARLLTSLGAGLAGMHRADVSSAPSDAKEVLRTFETGGACLVQEHIDGVFLKKMEACEEVADHPFLPFYRAHLAELRAEMALAGGDGAAVGGENRTSAGFPTGVMHGDPFPDNAFCDECTGEFTGFVDMEDCCVGPLLFDVACLVIGVCFLGENKENSISSNNTGETSETLDLGWVRQLLKGYCEVRPLTEAEKKHFAPFMRLVLLCNCAWRFVNFNVDHREVMTVQPGVENAYLELQKRIEALAPGGAACAGVEAAVAEVGGVCC